MDIALLAEGTYPYHPGGVSVWCDQLVRGLAPHRFTVHAITAQSGEEPVWDVPDNLAGVHSIPLWGPTPKVKRKVRKSKELQGAFDRLVLSMVDPTREADFLDGLHQLFLLSRDVQVAGALRTPASLEVLLEAMRMAPVGREVEVPPPPASVSDAKAALELIEHQLRPLYAPEPEADLCHADRKRSLGPAGPRGPVVPQHPVRAERARHLLAGAVSGVQPGAVHDAGAFDDAAILQNGSPGPGIRSPMSSPRAASTTGNGWRRTGLRRSVFTRSTTVSTPPTSLPAQGSRRSRRWSGWAGSTR